MNRERGLKIALVLVGLLFFAGVYPLTTSLWHGDASVSEGDKMMLSLYVTVGVFVLLAARNPSANRSLIAFTAWSSFDHASVIAMQAYQNVIGHGELMGVAMFAIVGIVLIALAPAKQSKELVSAA